ncbi:replication fork protection complex subunit Csm3 Swi3 [Fusarium albosuccineum]|uniref:Chromosome segregation in meiosis protein n=1 Tax=Fusarium albosuccineum TaxID=1237068 RepID=A0A8H4PBI5_9HYPO|nr:replication fork protection complex subunit Csm3 Swi3 [Fusarium albosuccineum]
MAAIGSDPANGLDNYDVDDFSDDPFNSPPPESSTKKRKEPDSGLGIDEEVNVQKRARVPNVKLDEDRLLGPKGIPKLRRRARDIEIKGKGHEFSDAARLLTFYQLWLDDLFPKAKFLDALGMVEKAGHKKRVMIARNECIDEGKPKESVAQEFADLLDEEEDASRPTDQEPSTSAAQAERPKTPQQDADVPDDDDLYDATPRPSRPIVPILNNAPDEDDLDALIAEAEGRDAANKSKPSAPEPDGDDLDALIAEAEGVDQAQKENGSGQKGGDKGADDFADEEAAMQEMDGLW